MSAPSNDETSTTPLAAAPVLSHRCPPEMGRDKMINLWGEEEPVPPPKAPKKRTVSPAQARLRQSKTNPCLAVYGQGPDGKQCRTCAFFLRLRYHDGLYFKCEKRGKPTHGPGTDHRARWPACGKYQEMQV